MNILVINAGSSSLKFQLIKIETEEVIAKGLCGRIGQEISDFQFKVPGREPIEKQIVMKDHADAIENVIAALTGENGVISDMSEIDAVGHRVVHGAESFKDSVLINDDVMKALEDCVELAPLHNPANIIGINACAKVMPGVKQVGVFDTAFHAQMPQKAYMYALPYELYENDKIRRYGFHGTSHKYVSQRAADMLGKDINDLKIITCHMGNGSSISAVMNGHSVDTTMGFTPIAGVPMGTRSGDIDPAIVTYLMNKKGYSAADVDKLLNKDSGVMGIAGYSDFRDLKAGRDNGDVKCALALDMFIYAVKKTVGAYAAAMGGADVIVFTAGIGENTPFIREEICEGLEFMGVKLDSEANKVEGQDKDISAADSKVKCLVIPTNEELMIAKDTARLAK